MLVVEPTLVGRFLGNALQWGQEKHQEHGCQQADPVTQFRCQKAVCPFSNQIENREECRCQG